MPRPALRVSLPVLRALRNGALLAGSAVAVACGIGSTSAQHAIVPDTHPEVPYDPPRALGELFHDVEMAHVFPDSKTFVDARPRSAPSEIVARYEGERRRPGFDLVAFVREHFDLPGGVVAVAASDNARPLTEHLRSLWPLLTRVADRPDPRSSLLPLPNRYVVPGGRFREVYYWDSYFTMLGLFESGRIDLVEGMLDNFAALVRTVGHVPNGNRSYYLGRSQPPFLAAMVGRYAQATDSGHTARYLDALEAEHAFWMEGADSIAPGEGHRRAVRLRSGALLNRYWDDFSEPRPESYREDEALGLTLPEPARAELYRNIRAAAESGWDFSSRWMRDPSDLRTIETTELAPLDLNCILYDAERTIAALRRARGLPGDAEVAAKFERAADARRHALLDAAWDESAGWLFDVRWRTGARVVDRPTMAVASALYFGVLTPTQGKRVAERLERDFLRPGGFVTTLVSSGQQWDAPNGWPPLQWMAIEGLRRYGRADLADVARARWLRTNERVFRATGRMMEKYDVIDTTRVAGGGEYPTQDGFGWTNGVALALSAQIRGASH